MLDDILHNACLTIETGEVDQVMQLQPHLAGEQEPFSLWLPSSVCQTREKRETRTSKNVPTCEDKLRPCLNQMTNLSIIFLKTSSLPYLITSFTNSCSIFVFNRAPLLVNSWCRWWLTWDSKDTTTALRSPLWKKLTQIAWWKHHYQVRHDPNQIAWWRYHHPLWLQTI